MTDDHHHDADGDGALTLTWDCTESPVVLALAEIKSSCKKEFHFLFFFN